MTITSFDQFTPAGDSAPAPGSSKAAAEAVQSFKSLDKQAAPQSESLPKAVDLGSLSDLNRLYGLDKSGGQTGDATDSGGTKIAAPEKNADPSADLHHQESAAKGANKHAEVSQDQTQPAAQHEHPYHVNQGDTLSQIAKDHLPKHTSTQEIYNYAKEIQQRNGIDDPRHLQAGSQIVLPEHHQRNASPSPKRDLTPDSQTDYHHSNSPHPQQNQPHGKPNPSQPSSPQDFSASSDGNPSTQVRTDQSPNEQKQKQPADQTPTSPQQQSTDKTPTTDEKQATDQKPLTTDQKPSDQHPKTTDKKPASDQDKKTDSNNQKPESKDQTKDTSDAKTSKNDDKPVGTVAQEKEELQKNADKITNPKGRQEFLDNVQKAHDDADKRRLSQQEVAKTYHEVNRLLTAGGTEAQQKDRTQLAQQVMAKAADPKSVDQGDYGTCGAASVESRTFQQNPSAAAKMVADVALNGKYTASDGTTVKGDQVEHKNHNRDHADEIFQTTAVNLHYQKQTDGDSKYSVGGDANNPAGFEHVTNTKTGKTHDFEGLTATDVGELSNMITGKNEKDVVLTRDDLDPPSKDGSATHVNSEKELQQKIKEQTDQGKTPIIWVDSNSQPFLNDRGDLQAGARNDAGHFVRVSGYHDGDQPSVDIDNQWGAKSDHDSVPLHDIYEAMNPDEKERAKELEADSAQARAEGHPNHAKELQAIQAHQEAGDYKTETQHRRTIESTIKQIQKDWQDSPPEDQERQDTLESLDHVIDNLSYVWSQQHERALEQRLLGAA